MDNDTQALFEKNYTKGFPAEGMSEQTVGSASRKSDAFPGNKGPLCLLSTARAQRKAPLRTANTDGIVTKKDMRHVLKNSTSQTTKIFVYQAG